MTVSGNTESYEIFCDSIPTIHFVFVRDSSSDDWQHCLTTNEVAISEIHDWYYVIARYINAIRCKDDANYDKTLFPEDYEFRYTNAINAYRYDKATYTAAINEYTVVVETDRGAEEVFTLEIICPEDQTDLFRYSMQ